MIMVRRIPEAFYRVHTLEGSGGSPPYMGPGVKACGRKWFEGISKGLNEFSRQASCIFS